MQSASFGHNRHSWAIGSSLGRIAKYPKEWEHCGGRFSSFAGGLGGLNSHLFPNGFHMYLASWCSLGDFYVVCLNISVISSSDICPRSNICLQFWKICFIHLNPWTNLGGQSMTSSARAKAKCLYNSFGRGREEHKESEEMRNKQKYNRNSKVELPKRYRKNKK